MGADFWNSVSFSFEIILWNPRYNRQFCLNFGHVLAVHRLGLMAWDKLNSSPFLMVISTVLIDKLHNLHKGERNIIVSIYCIIYFTVSLFSFLCRTFSISRTFDF
jgi:hypothetical protein